MREGIILAVGNEILSGDTLDTNSHFLCKRLSQFNIKIVKILTLPDNELILRKEIHKALSEVDLIFTIGGLGPTLDDLTKEVVAKVFQQELVENSIALQNVKDRLKNREHLLEINSKQAYFPENAKIIVNDLGTAPGGILEKGNQKVFLLPGPPEQCRHIFEKMTSFLPYTEDTSSRKVLKLEGVVEAEISQLLNDLMQSENPSVKPYAGKEGRRLVLEAYDTKDKTSKMIINELEGEIRRRLGEYIYGEDDETIEFVLFNLLEKFNLSVATAESFTGGEIASTLISISGMSNYLSESLVTYSEEAKESLLDVSKETIKKYGVVSYEVAEEMLIGLENKFNRNLNISSTGFAGPGENAGFCYIGISLNGEKQVFKNHFLGSRNDIRQYGTNFALFQAWKFILDKY